MNDFSLDDRVMQKIKNEVNKKFKQLTVDQLVEMVDEVRDDTDEQKKALSFMILEYE